MIALISLNLSVMTYYSIAEFINEVNYGLDKFRNN